MKSILRKVILVLSLAFGLQTNVKAQLVYIPDPNFRSWLNAFVGCMVGDSIDPACPGVLNTKHMNMNFWNISNLSGIEVFVNDTLLRCSFNNLVSLPALSNSLTYLECGENQLTSLPALPSSLESLFCSGNQLTVLPSLPSSLTILGCSGNQLTELPSLPSSLAILGCSENPLIGLPSLPKSLTFLMCAESQLTSLPTLPQSLEFLNCPDNQLTSLPILPNSLTEFVCRGNLLTKLPTLPSSLSRLECEFNQLTSLPLLPDSLVTLFCSSNPIKYLPDLNNVTFLDFENTLVECLPNYGIVIRSSPLITSIPLCDNDINIDIQPNPFISELKIKLDKDYSGEFEVYNSLGEIIISEKLQGKNISLSTINWNAGMYILKVATNDGVVVKKVVKR